MKKIKLIPFAVLCMAIALSGCSSAKKTEQNKDNDKESKKTEVIFSAEGGVYSDEFTLTLSTENGTEIYYTTDGSNPADSDTAILYEDGIEIKDRSGDANVVSAVDPALISTNFARYSNSQGKVISNVEAPSDDAVDKCTVIRAAALLEDGTYSETVGMTYFIGTMEEHIEGLAASCEAAGQSLAVISITTDYDSLFDEETGIYVGGNLLTESLADYNGQDEIRKLAANYNQRGRDWEREAHMDFFEVDTESMELELSQNCGIRIQGNYSRSDLQKGFRLYARESYGEKKFDYAVWDNEDITSYKTLVLRAGGNCAFTAKFNDTYWQTLADEIGLMCETKDSRPCVVYLNGEYWGLYVLEEDYSDNYFEDHYDVDQDDVIVYKGDAETYARGYKLDIGEVPEGEMESYYFSELTDFMTKNKSYFPSNDTLEAFGELVDLDSLCDYFALEVWINNKWDWPGKNWGMWKVYTDDEDAGDKYADNEYGDGKWRFMFFDVEFGGVSGSSDASTNTIKEDNYKDTGLLETNTESIATRCFACAMKNESFRKKFYDRLNELSVYFDENAEDKLDYFINVYEPLLDQFFERYPGCGSTNDAINGGYASAKCIRDFVTNRSKYIQKMIDWVETIY